MAAHTVGRGVGKLISLEPSPRSSLPSEHQLDMTLMEIGSLLVHMRLGSWINTIVCSIISFHNCLITHFLILVLIPHQSYVCNQHFHHSGRTWIYRVLQANHLWRLLLWVSRSFIPFRQPHTQLKEGVGKTEVDRWAPFYTGWWALSGGWIRSGWWVCWLTAQLRPWPCYIDYSGLRMWYGHHLFFSSSIFVALLPA